MQALLDYSTPSCEVTIFKTERFSKLDLHSVRPPSLSIINAARRYTCKPNWTTQPPAVRWPFSGRKDSHFLTCIMDFVIKQVPSYCIHGCIVLVAQHVHLRGDHFPDFEAIIFRTFADQRLLGHRNVLKAFSSFLCNSIKITITWEQPYTFKFINHFMELTLNVKYNSNPNKLCQNFKLYSVTVMCVNVIPRSKSVRWHCFISEPS